MLPQDAVFLSRLFSETVSAEIRLAGGTECDPSADGAIAVFGIGIRVAISCRSALLAANRVDGSLAGLADRVKRDFGVSPDFALCLHVGPAAVGPVGSSASQRYTVAGPVIETTRRLMAGAARSRLRIVVSIDLLRQAGAPRELLEQLAPEAFDDVPGTAVAVLTSFDRLEVLLAS